MPINAGPEFFKAQEKYLSAKTREEKIAALEEMIKYLPKHKGTENLLGQLKAKLAKLKEQQERERKGGRRKSTLRKEGDILVCIIGFTNSGKTTLLNLLAGTDFKTTSQPYETTEPLVATADYGNAKIQLVEIPSFFRKADLSIAHTSDCIVLIGKTQEEIEELKRLLKEYRIEKPVFEFTWQCSDKDEIKKKIWELSGMIRIYTKERGKKPAKKPIVVKKGSTVKDVVECIHEDFLKYFKFAKIWGPSAKFDGEKVGLDHVLEDGDIIEVRIK
jgi:ribosome-interacting GTPase 1